MKHYCSFSEAIRAADGVLRQSFFGPGAREILSVDKGKVCALEGGIHMMGIRKGSGSDWIYSIAKHRYPYLANLSDCPRCQEHNRETLVNLIWHLNDDHQLTFAQIADWLESEEEKIGFVHVVESGPQAIYAGFALSATQSGGASETS